MKHTKRAAVLVHYDRDDMVDPYLYVYIQALKPCVSHLIFVSTVKLDDIEIKKLKKYCDTVIIRENVGYDFMSYKVGLSSFDYKKYDEVLLCNDSVYGPLYPMQTLFDSMQANECDFWGITDNTVMGYHIQSYFIVLKNSVLLSTHFSSFWKLLTVLDEKDEIIKRYEIGFSQVLINAGFNSAISAKFQPSISNKFSIFIRKLTPKKIIKKIKSLLLGKEKMTHIGKINTSHYFWKELLISEQVPFIKIELLRDNPMQVNIKNYKNVIQQVSSYDTALIENHLARMKNKDTE